MPNRSNETKVLDLLQTQAEMLKDMREQSNRDRRIHLDLLRQAKDQKDLEIRLMREKELKRRLVIQPTDVKFGEFDARKLTQSAKGLLFYISEYLESVRLTLTARVPDEITLGNGSKESAGNALFKGLKAVVIGEYKALTKNRTHVYNTDAELKTLRQLEKEGFIDINQWAVNGLREVLPATIISEHISGDTTGEGSSETSISPDSSCPDKELWCYC